MDMPLQCNVSSNSGTSGIRLDNHNVTYHPDCDLCYEMLHGVHLRKQPAMRKNSMIGLETTESDHYALSSKISESSNNAGPWYDINFKGASSAKTDSKHSHEPNDTMDAALGLVKLGHGHSPSEDRAVLALVKMRKVRLEQSQNQVSGVADNIQRMNIGKDEDAVDLVALAGSETNGSFSGCAEQKRDGICAARDGLFNEEIILQLSQGVYSMRIATQGQF
ncbi:hypothetical protein D9619_012574 [Psilocybe cf. subviscida]|uniref:Uncharacterized protein n=1 Tax=Psilocybe cf. subviscida TaxID=2480587 RepID=A0A8H5B7H2_9AGAR|nr:hypothetical protein D9619_012574 [Psilocybe cf. subviscida]